MPAPKVLPMGRHKPRLAAVESNSVGTFASFTPAWTVVDCWSRHDIS
jgi:hypothetical protein